MSDKIFIDANVLVYSIDDSEGFKNLAAKSIVNELSNSKGVISTQVLQEFYNIITKKMKCPKEKAKELLQSLSECFEVHKNSVLDILRAVDISIKTQFSFWDSLIISAAISSGCRTLYSEDLNDGQNVDGVLIKNPL